MTGLADASYTPGSWVAIAAPGVWILVDIDADTEVLQEWWTAVQGGASIDDVLGLFAQEGFRRVPSFAVVGYDLESGTGALVLRGEATACLTGPSGTADVDAATAATWVRQDIEAEVESVVLASPHTAEHGMRLPLSSGVSMAASVTIVTGDLPPITATSARPRKKSQPRSQKAPRRSADPLPEPEAVSVSIDEPAAVEEVRVEALPDVEVVGATSGPEVPSFDHLFGATARPPSKADGVPHAEITIETLAPSDTMHPIREAPTASGPPGLIDALPWAIEGPPVGSEASVASAFTPTPPVSSPPVAPRLIEPTTNDATVNRAALLAEAGVAPPHSGPTVKALRCAAGHLSPAHANECRICHSELPPQGAITAPRPILGSIRLSTGDVVTLDRGVLLGREPQPHDGSDPDRPHVLKLASPEKDISREHLEVRLDGWHVLVIDLDSTNGTMVTLPGQEPQRLYANEPLAIEPGTLVSLADEVTFVYEVGQ